MSNNKLFKIKEVYSMVPCVRYHTKRRQEENPKNDKQKLLVFSNYYVER
jgi:hypothetical protein